ncbi:MAG: hypothetical protein WAP55_02900 [Minisyncoccia bacterium]
MNLLSLLTGVAVIGASVLALEGVNQITQGEFYLASISHLAQESSQSAVTTVESHPATTPTSNVGAPPPPPPPAPMEQTPPMPVPPNNNEGGKGGFITDEGEQPQEFYDPRHIQDGLRNMNQFRGEIKRTLREIRKQASQADLDELNNVLAEVDKLYSIASNSSNLADANDAVREFHDNQYWEKINAVRARLQIPKEIKQITQSIKRLEKVLKTKSIQNIGLDIARTQQTLAEMKQAADAVQNLYNAGNYQEAQEEMRFFHEGGQPGEIEGVIFRIRDIKNMAKRVKDTAVRAEVDGVLQEVIDTFNAGEYRDARETMDEYADDLQRLISQLVQAQSRRGYNRRESSTRVQSLGELIGRKLQEANDNQGQQTFPSK